MSREAQEKEKLGSKKRQHRTSLSIYNVFKSQLLFRPTLRTWAFFNRAKGILTHCSLSKINVNCDCMGTPQPLSSGSIYLSNWLFWVSCPSESQADLHSASMKVSTLFLETISGVVVHTCNLTMKKRMLRQENLEFKGMGRAWRWVKAEE